jgi:predicted RNA-binding protein with PUA-like domain
MNHWLVKQEPESYSWSDFVKEGRAAWTGVRNFQARNNLRSMQKDDLVFFYHSGDQKEIVGLARVGRGPYPDPTADEGEWVAVDLIPVRVLAKSVALSVVKADKRLNEILLVRNSRLSVSPLTKIQFDHLLELAATKV